MRSILQPLAVERPPWGWSEAYTLVPKSASYTQVIWIITSCVHSQLFPQLAGVKVKAEDNGKLFPVGVPVNTQVPHSSVGLHPLHPFDTRAKEATSPSIHALFILIWVTSYRTFRNRHRCRPRPMSSAICSLSVSVTRNGVARQFTGI